jgi:hypothetical protein
MKIIQVEQNTEAWRKARIGIPTASRFSRIITPKGAPVDSRERKAYIYRLVAERLLNEPMPEEFTGNNWTERGERLEARAADEFSKKMGVALIPAGFLTSDHGRYGASPDRLIARVKPHEAAEIKAPAAWTHIQYMCEGPGEKYKPQVQGQILVGGFEAVHFWSYHPAFAPVHIVTLPDEVYLHKLENLLELFCDEVDATERWVRKNGNTEEIIWGIEHGKETQA